MVTKYCALAYIDLSQEGTLPFFVLFVLDFPIQVKIYWHLEIVWGKNKNRPTFQQMAGWRYRQSRELGLHMKGFVCVLAYSSDNNYR